MLKGIISIWSGVIVDIPDDYALCDGNNGTPDLTNLFVRGAGNDFDPGDTGGSFEHDHNFTGDGHSHAIGGGFGVAGGANLSNFTSAEPSTGTTDLANHAPPYYALAYIMKLHDDPDPRAHLPWPYASKAIIEHKYSGGALEIYITFRFSMNTDNKPADGLWIVDADEVEEAIDSSLWIDQWTMLLTIDPLVSSPFEVTVEYDGPSPLLATTWDKQWEPWGAIQSVELRTPPETKTFTTGPAAQDDVDITGIKVLLLDATGNDITIGGFVGGTRGQVLHIAKVDESANDVTLEDHEGGGNQDIHLHAELDETLTGEHGGWHLVCDGSDWYDTSHSKHV